MTQTTAATADQPPAPPDSVGAECAALGTFDGRPLRVVQVMAGGREGGAETFFLEAVLALDEAGLEQVVVTRPNSAFRLDALARRGIPVATASFDRWWRWPTERVLGRSIAAFEPDVIQYWMGRAGTFARADRRARGIGWYGGYYKVRRFRNCAYHVGVTRDIKRHIVAQGVAESHVRVISTFVDLAPVAPIPRARLDTPEDAPLLLALARLHWKKGLDVLLEALVRVPDAYLWIAGDGPLRDELAEQARSLAIEDRVRFLGWRDDRAALLAACDIVAFPSRYEPFGTVTVDAWAARRAIVAAKARGPEATITHEKDGLLVEIDDVDGLAQAIRRLIGDPGLRERLVAGGSETYRRSFTKEAFVRASVAFYRGVAEAARGSAAGARASA